MIGKEHKNLIRDIRRYVGQLGQSKIAQSDFFTESTYQNSQNKTQPCYLVTKKGCEFIAHKLTGQKGTEFTARDLYEFLELGQGQFSRWSKSNIENNEFYEENVDWWGFDMMSNGNKCKDYKLTTDLAKHLCMESHSSKGKIARQYFIACEQGLKKADIDAVTVNNAIQAISDLTDNSKSLDITHVTAIKKKVHQGICDTD